MAIIPETENINYQSLSFVPSESEVVVYHFAAQVDTLPLGLPFPLMESKQKKDLLNNLLAMAKDIETKFKGINVRLFKLKFLAPGRVDEIFDDVKRPITVANYDVVCMVVCDNIEIATAFKVDKLYKEIQTRFQKFLNFNIVTAKNIRKAGDSFVHSHKKDGVFLFNYFYVENLKFDFLPVWEHTSRWFAEYTHLTNSYLLKITDGDNSFQYINHCYWPSMFDFVPQLIFRRSAKTYVIDNFSLNKAIAFPIIYQAIW